MFAADIYRPAEWHDFFVMVGGAAAVLTGLVFVALSLNLHLLLTDPMHRARSIGTLTNFGGVFLIAAIALMGEQTHVSIAIEGKRARPGGSRTSTRERRRGDEWSFRMTFGLFARRVSDGRLAGRRFAEV